VTEKDSIVSVSTISGGFVLYGRRLSSDIDVPASRISEILNGHRPITADTALRLGIYFSMDPIFWVNLQADYDVRIAIRDNKKILQSRIRVYQRLAA